MRRIKSNNTKPERIIRTFLRKASIKVHSHDKHLAGKPDIVIPSLRRIVFVNGCFWHHHKGCKRATWPKSNSIYWKTKIKRNMARDEENLRQLKKAGWKTTILWECEIDLIDTLPKIKRIIQESVDHKTNHP